jgi:hypothetical protein
MTVKSPCNISDAILIESIEPRQNRKQGNLFYGLQYLQQEAPEIKKRLKVDIIRELVVKLEINNETVLTRKTTINF